MAWFPGQKARLLDHGMWLSTPILSLLWLQNLTLFCELQVACATDSMFPSKFPSSIQPPEDRRCLTSQQWPFLDMIRVYSRV